MYSNGLREKKEMVKEYDFDETAVPKGTEYLVLDYPVLEDDYSEDSRP